MTNSTLSAPMARQRKIAESFGFTLNGKSGLFHHGSGFVALAILDEEGTWEAILLADRPSRFSESGFYRVETGRVRLTNLTSRQFEAVLLGLLQSVDPV